MTDGGPAFPTTTATESGHVVTDDPGMSLRDWFAGQALAGFIPMLPTLPSSKSPTAATALIQDAVAASYRAADAMLAARAK